MEVAVAPSVDELIAIIALLSQEADLLRERFGEAEIRFKRRVFTRQQLRYGMSLCAQASARPGGSIELRMES